jgi:hypothetical protein
MPNATATKITGITKTQRFYLDRNFFETYLMVRFEVVVVVVLVVELVMEKARRKKKLILHIRHFAHELQEFFSTSERYPGRWLRLSVFFTVTLLYTVLYGRMRAILFHQGNLKRNIERYELNKM